MPSASRINKGVQIVELLKNSYIKNALVAVYVLVQGYFLGLALIWVLPVLPGVEWPFNLIPGYALGLFISLVIGWIVYKELKISRNQKVIVALVLLLLAVVAGYAFSNLGLEDAKMRAAEVLG